jgi:2-amino-4-hydroxy-6-hydroxymethyldihydropteridine diphosphokinase
MRSRRVVVGIGANLGDRLASLDAATARIAAIPGVTALRRSPIVETDPVGGPPQGRYFNGAVLVETALPARAVLEALLGIERDLGRTRDGTRDAPRTLDLDILWIDGEALDEPDLVVPHPRLATRAFALVPLVALAPDAADVNGGLYASLVEAKTSLIEIGPARSLP